MREATLNRCWQVEKRQTDMVCLRFTPSPPSPGRTSVPDRSSEFVMDGLKNEIKRLKTHKKKSEVAGSRFLGDVLEFQIVFVLCGQLA